MDVFAYHWRGLGLDPTGQPWDSLYLDLSTYFVGWASGWGKAKSQPTRGPYSGLGKGLELNPRLPFSC